MKKIVILLSTGIAVRNFLESRAIENILAGGGCDVKVITPWPELFKNYSNKVELTYDSFKYSGIVERLLFIINRRRAYKIYETVSSRILSEHNKKNGIYPRISEYLSYPFPRSKLVFNFLQKCLLTLSYCRGVEPNNLLDASLVVSTSPNMLQECRMLSFAKFKKIPILAVIKSWDNLTTKGYFPILPDFYAVWTEWNKSELIEIFGINPALIEVTGALPFDTHLAYKANDKDKVNLKREFGLDVNKKTIFFATNHKSLTPDDGDFIKVLSLYAAANDAEVFVRLHQADCIERYKMHRYSNVIYQLPGNIGKSNSAADRLISGGFLKGLLDALIVSDVIVVTASTVSIDAAFLDRPVINRAFDVQARPYLNSIRRFYDFDHYKKLLSENSVSLAHSVPELYCHIDEYIRNPTSRQLERLNLRDKFHSNSFSTSSKHLASYIKSILEEQKA